MRPLAILVLSCDKYSAFWPIFFARFEKYWPDCPYDIFLLTNEKDFVHPRVQTIKTGQDVDWSSNLLYALDRIGTGDVLLMLEDAPLDGHVNQQLFVRIHEQFCELEMNFLNMKAEVPPPIPSGSLFGEIPRGTHYRVTAVPNLWRTAALRDLIVPGESAWAFEVRGSERSDRLPNFYSLGSRFFDVLHCVIQGQLDRRAARVLRSTGEIAGIAFPEMSLATFMRIRIREVRTIVFNHLIPWYLRRRFRSAFYRLFLRRSKLI